MQNQGNCYKNVWILSGTSDGPVIANRLLELNYSVFASVLTYKAGQAYIENPKLHIITGKLKNKDQIINFINKNKITCVVDATHPFAVIISKNLNNACKEINTPLLLFERKSLINKSNNFFYIYENVQRPGKYEFKSTDTYSDLINFGLGVSDYMVETEKLNIRALKNNKMIVQTRSKTDSVGDDNIFSLSFSRKVFVVEEDVEVIGNGVTSGFYRIEKRTNLSNFIKLLVAISSSIQTTDE